MVKDKTVVIPAGTFKIPAVYYTQNVMDPAKKDYNLIIYLSGAGGASPYGPDIDKIANSGEHSSLLTNGGDKNGFLVLAPQFIQSYNGWQNDWKGAEYLNWVIDWALQKLPINKANITLTGYSQGGCGTWDYGIRKIEYTKKIRNYVMVAAGGQEGSNKLFVEAGSRVWAFHGTADSVPAVNLQNLVKELNDAKINPPAKITLYPGKGHGIVSDVYSTQALYDWIKQDVPTQEPPVEPPVFRPTHIIKRKDGSAEEVRIETL